MIKFGMSLFARGKAALVAADSSDDEEDPPMPLLAPPPPLVPDGGGNASWEVLPVLEAKSETEDAPAEDAAEAEPNFGFPSDIRRGLRERNY